MKYKISLNGLEFYAYHGLYPEEKVVGGAFIVDLEIATIREDREVFESIHDTVNYEDLFALVASEMATPRELVEQVAKAILDKLYIEVNGIESASVRITKKNPAGFFKSGNAVVTLSR